MTGLATSVATSPTVAAQETTDDEIDATLVEADPAAGFNYPYYLYTPEQTADQPRPILVEPNNTGGAIDDFSVHLEMAGRLVEDHWPRTLSDELGVPLLVPVFPRPVSEPVDITHYVHALDTETMHIQDGDLARVDLQLRRMVDHAKERLADSPGEFADRVVMDGFSATGNFVNRFTALHPDFVTSVTAGGINGTAILPLEEAKGHTLHYQIGVADLPDLVGHPFDRERWTEVDQLVYMGAEDQNDTIPPEDTDIPADEWDTWSPEQREIALDVYGEDMQEDRMPYCESVYEDAGASADFRIYDGVGHEVTADIVADLVEFHRSNMDDLTVTETPTATPTADERATDTASATAADPATDADAATDGSGPGFGIAGGLAAGLATIGAASLWARSGDDERGE